MEVTGIIEAIKYRNEENGYTVCSIDMGNLKITAIGKFPIVYEGEKVKIEGDIVANSTFGEQLKVTRITILKQDSVEAIKRYLSSGLIYGIGPKSAEKIVEKFGIETLDIIEKDYSKLALIKGISITKAREIYDAFINIKQMQDAVMFLQAYDISIGLSVKIFNNYKNNTITIVERNPYQLIEDIDGVGFLTADRIARKLGIGEDSEFRVRAGMVHILKQFTEKTGSTYIPRAQFDIELHKLLGAITSNEEVIEKVLVYLQMDNVIRVWTQNEQDCIMLSKFYSVEKEIAIKIRKMIMQNQKTEFEIANDIQNFQQINKIELHKEQENAITMAIREKISIITGGPGTGKTTIIKCIIDVCKHLGKDVRLLAPTGRASKRLNETTGAEASTIHRALDLDYKNGNGFFTFNEKNKLPQDVIIVDEMSMVDVMLFSNLLKAVKLDASLVLVGDKDQLASVGAGNVLRDLLKSDLVPTVTLTQIFRQENGSLIISNAHRINEGQMPLIDNTSRDFFYDAQKEQPDILKSIISMVTTRIPKTYNIEPRQIQVLAPLKAGLCGVDNLNIELQNKLNPSKFGSVEVASGKYTFRTGDKVMQISNNYQMKWTRFNGFSHEAGMGVFNGDIGYITNILRETREVTVEFEDGRTAKYLFTDLSQLVLSYAITIHKSQGSEFDIVLIPLMAGSPQILTRNLIYTAVTRAKNMAVLVGPKLFLSRMVRNNYTEERWTKLKDFLLDDKLPISII